MKRMITCSLAALAIVIPALAQEGPPPPRRGPGGPGGPGGPPADVTIDIEPQIVQQKMKTVGFIGVAPGEVAPELATQLGLPAGIGLTVIHILPDSPAASAGLQKHDVLHKLDDQLLVNVEQLRTLVQNKAKGDTVKLTVIRQAKSTQVDVTVGETTVPMHPMRGRGMHMMPMDGDRMGPPRGRPDEGRRGEGGPPEGRREGDRMGPPEGGPGGGHMGAPRGPRDGERMGPPPHPDDMPPGPAGEGPRADIRRTDETVTATRIRTGAARYRDDDHELALTMTGDSKTLVAKDTKDGTVIFEGPVNTAEEREKLPAAIRPKLEKLETLRPPEFRPRDGMGPGGPPGADEPAI